MKVEIEINNLPKEIKYPFIVSRLVDNKLWFYGQYESMKRAEAVQDMLNDAVICEVSE